MPTKVSSEHIDGERDAEEVAAAEELEAAREGGERKAAGDEVGGAAQGGEQAECG